MRVHCVLCCFGGSPAARATPRPEPSFPTGRASVRVTFEVLLASVGLEDDRGLSRLGAMVHALDVGGATTPEASGFEAVLAGARKRWPDDDAQLGDSGGAPDAVHAQYPRNRKTRRPT